MQPEGYGAVPMDLHIPQQGYHPYYRKGHDDNSGSPVVQTRILEMRKEKSRDAARSRRGKENFEFYELAKMLPLPGAITTQLDKASIIRLTISFLKLKDFVSHGDPPWRRDGPTLKGGTLRSRSIATDLFEQHQATHILQSLDGFAFALGADGRFLYVSETVSIYLGLSQVEMTGSTVFDYIHQQDQAELADAIGINVCHSPSATSPASVVSDEGSSSNPGTSTPTSFDRPPSLMTVNNPISNQCLRRSFCVRMKSTLTKRGCHFKSSGYRVVLILASLRPQYAFSTVRKTPLSIMGLVAVAIALPPPSVNELRLEQDMFVTRLTFDFRISHCEPRVSDLLEYTSEEITGRNMYSLCHAQDAEKIRKCHGDLIQKGQVVTGYYRLMSKSGGYVWLQSCATVICNTKNAEEETIICVNYVLSNIEYDHCIMDYAQLPSSRELRSEEPTSSEKGSTSPDKEAGRDNTSTGDVDPGHSAPKLERCGSKDEDGENFDRATDQQDVNNEQDQPHRNSETSPCQTSSPTSFPGCTYLDTDELDRLGVGGNNNNNSSASPIDALEKGNENDVSCSSRHRKRKHADNEPSKSPKSRPGSTTSSSLEVLSLDNGNYLPNENGGEQQLQLPGSAQSTDSLPPQLEQPDSVESDHNSADKNDKTSNVSRPWTRSPVSVSSPLDPPYHSQQHLHDDVGSLKNGTSSSSGNGMSVRELEDAMNRHLPHDNSSPTGASSEVLMLKSYATASAGAPAPQHGHHPRQSIQWISGGAPATLPATSLLRQIYVSRESVIRSGAHASRSSGSGCYGGDVHQGTLPTPPAGQGEPAYGDTAQLMLQSAAKLSAADAAAAYGVISGFTSSGYVDTCNAMTPPSSVSPRDKFNSDATSAFNEAAAVAAAAAIPHMRHYVTADPNSLQHLPLKHPQLFVHPGNLDHHHHHGSYGHAQQALSPDQHQLYHHPSSFHLYHPAPGGSKPSLHATNGSSWFCQPHS